MEKDDARQAELFQHAHRSQPHEASPPPGSQTHRRKGEKIHHGKRHRGIGICLQPQISKAGEFLAHVQDAQGTYRRACTWADRKSTRLNSSHANISYAVFCLKKKKKKFRLK